MVGESSRDFARLDTNRLTSWRQIFRAICFQVASGLMGLHESSLEFVFVGLGGLIFAPKGFEPKGVGSVRFSLVNLTLERWLATVS